MFLRLEVWPGYVTAVDEYEGGLMLQCDVSHRVLRTETAHDILKKCARSANVYDEFEKALLGATVLTKYVVVRFSTPHIVSLFF